MNEWERKVAKCKKFKKSLKVGQVVRNLRSGNTAKVNDIEFGADHVVEVLRLEKKVYWNIDSLWEFRDVGH